MGLIPSPFGERFHFRTSLSIDECIARIDALAATFVPVTDFSGQPFSTRIGNRFSLYERQAGVPPELKARLSSEHGWTHIVGRGGSNLEALVATLVALAVTLAIGLYSVFVEDMLSLWSVAMPILVVPLIILFRFWKDPHAERLIDFVQELLEAHVVVSVSRRH